MFLGLLQITYGFSLLVVGCAIWLVATIIWPFTFVIDCLIDRYSNRKEWRFRGVL